MEGQLKLSVNENAAMYLLLHMLIKIKVCCEQVNFIQKF